MLVLIIILILLGSAMQWSLVDSYRRLLINVKNTWKVPKPSGLSKDIEKAIDDNAEKLNENTKRMIDQYTFEAQLRSGCFGAAAMGLIMLYG